MDSSEFSLQGKCFLSIRRRMTYEEGHRNPSHFGCGLARRQLILAKGSALEIPSES